MAQAFVGVSDVLDLLEALLELGRRQTRECGYGLRVFFVGWLVRARLVEIGGKDAVDRRHEVGACGTILAWGPSMLSAICYLTR